MKKIKLTNTKEYALVDNEDYSGLVGYKWRKDKKGYAWRTINIPIDVKIGRKFRTTTIFMHRQILNAPQGMMVDHRNFNRLDNRKCNIRLCTPSENQRNIGVTKNNRTGYKGVGWNKRDKRYVVKIRLNGKCLHIGSFKEILDGAKAYNEAAKKYFGEFAWLNKV